MLIYVAYFFIIIVLLTLTLRCNFKEHMTTAESQQILSNVYDPNSMTTNNLTVTGDVTVSTLNILPRGIILMWNTTTAPTGWAICDGTNGTPNLINRFIYGSSLKQSSSSSSASMNSTDIGTSGGTNGAILTTNNLPAHSHQYTSYASLTNDNCCLPSYYNVCSVKWHGIQGPPGQCTGTFCQIFDPNIGRQNDQTAIQANANNAPIPNMPPYVTLTYIMKL